MGGIHKLVSASKDEPRSRGRFRSALARVLDGHPQRAKLIKPLPETEQMQLQALVARRRQLVLMFTSERNRLATSHKVARRCIEAIIKALKRQLKHIEAELARHIANRHADLASLLTSVKGVGDTTAATLTADVPELGKLSRREKRPESRAKGATPMRAPKCTSTPSCLKLSVKPPKRTACWHRVFPEAGLKLLLHYA